MFWALHWAVSRNLCDDFYLDINLKLTALLAVANLYLCHWSANCKLANLCLWFISSANSTVLRPIAFPRSALCLRVSCKINKNYECETLSPLHHRFCCKFPRIPKKPRKMESQFLKGDFVKNYFSCPSSSILTLRTVLIHGYGFKAVQTKPNPTWPSQLTYGPTRPTLST